MKYNIISSELVEEIFSSELEPYLDHNVFDLALDEENRYVLLVNKELVLTYNDLVNEDTEKHELLDIIIKLCEEYKKKYPYNEKEDNNIEILPCSELIFKEELPQKEVDENLDTDFKKITLPTLQVFLDKNIKTIDLGDLNILITIDTLWNAIEHGFDDGIFYNITFKDKISNIEKSIKYNYKIKEDLTILDLLELAKIF